MTEAPSPPPANAPLQGDAILYTKNGFYWNISFPLALPLPGGSIATVLRPTRRSCGRSRSVSIISMMEPRCTRVLRDAP